MKGKKAWKGKETGNRTRKEKERMKTKGKEKKNEE